MNCLAQKVEFICPSKFNCLSMQIPLCVNANFVVCPFQYCCASMHFCCASMQIANRNWSFDFEPLEKRVIQNNSFIMSGTTFQNGVF